MKQIFGLLIGVCVLIMGGLILWNLHSKVTIPTGIAAAAAPKPVETHVESAEEAQARQMVTLTGPLADYMSNQDKPKASDGDAEPAPRPFNPADRVGDSPVGTSTPILKKTFTVAKAVDLPFEIPPHAASPQLHGTYRSFLQRGGTRSSDDADVEFLLMNQRQYEDLLNGHPADAQFSAEGAHNGEVNTNMPPTLDHPVKYYLVFRNDSNGPGKVLVQADFRVDF
jgi:hypothetical protein